MRGVRGTPLWELGASMGRRTEGCGACTGDRTQVWAVWGWLGCASFPSFEAYLYVGVRGPARSRGRELVHACLGRARRASWGSCCHGSGCGSGSGLVWWMGGHACGGLGHRVVATPCRDAKGHARTDIAVPPQPLLQGTTGVGAIRHEGVVTKEWWDACISGPSTQRAIQTYKA